MKRKVACTVVLLTGLMVTACQQGSQLQGEPWEPNEPYNGYKMSPYTLKGMRFVPMSVEQALRYNAVGVASHYEANGAVGAIGQPLYSNQYYAAHRTLPLPCLARVTNLENGESCLVRIADRGPYIAGRLIDVSTAVAHRLKFHNNGLTRVRIQVVSVGEGAYRRARRS